MPNAVIGQSGGPTAVINQSLVGCVLALREAGIADRVYAMRHGVAGLVRTELVDLTDTPADVLERVARTPSAALGSTRDKPDEAYCEKILDTCRERDIGLFFYIGGNDSSDTCRIVNDLAHKTGYALRCFHVPKTVDNDLVLNDHTPGFPSAARFVAMAFMADAMDNRSLPGVKINVVMGRHAGFLTAASVLARRGGMDSPHLIYTPEMPFDTDRFVQDVARVYDERGRCQIAVSEGIQDENGRSIGAALIEGEKDAHGNVQLSGSGALGDRLADLVKRKLTPAGGKPPRVRADTFGYIQRCWPDVSPVDAREARGAGQFAVQCAAEGAEDGSIAIQCADGPSYEARFTRVALADVAGKTRTLPREFLDGDNNITDVYARWLTPLVGDLPEFATV